MPSFSIARKVVIKFEDGTYWQHHQQTTPDLREAWTFNREQGALETIARNTTYDVMPGGEGVGLTRPNDNILHRPSKIVPVEISSRFYDGRQPSVHGIVELQ